MAQSNQLKLSIYKIAAVFHIHRFPWILIVGGQKWLCHHHLESGRNADSGQDPHIAQPTFLVRKSRPVTLSLLRSTCPPVQSTPHLPPPAPPNLPHHDKYTQTIVEDIKQSILVPVLGSVWLALFVFLAIFIFLAMTWQVVGKPRTEVVGVCNTIVISLIKLMLQLCHHGIWGLVVESN